MDGMVNYVDDTNILVSGKTLSEVTEEAGASLSGICSWFNRNELALNASKTNIMVFRTKNSRINLGDSINLNGEEMKPVPETRFLGVHIDEFLDWNNHVEKTGLRLSSIGYGIRVVSRYMDEKTLKILHQDELRSNYVHGYNTRTTNLTYPSHRLTSTEKGPYYMCIKLYNKLPNTCRLSSLIKFKHTIRKLLIKLEPYSLGDFLNCNNLPEFV
ncbi:uncharacterized protein LOC123322832 [Coccinella septempunctata]|uniref:uncharacterized protein LOC123322832 n=1 Tax=Coccinella septempunctata TaxID=41139 RepID=UPI001D0682AD|nr:uncharacterized protein LOC123322832 [Coccinella septempunctata]